jgi:uncharacterized protein (DUF697 family)
VKKPKPDLPVHPAAVLGLVQELRAAAQQEAALLVLGGGELASVLRRELARGGVASAVREGGPVANAGALVYVLTGEASEADVAVLREADRARVPAVCVVVARRDEQVPVPPYVLAERVVRVPSGAGFPLEEIARALARALGEQATPLAARLPVLRNAVSAELVRRFSLQNAVIGAALFIPGADMPVLTLNEIRLLLRIADAHGFELGKERIPEVLGVIGTGFGLRAVARQALGVVPVAGWAVKGAIAYMGTRALGEAARRYFAARAPVTRVAGDRSVFPR